MKGALNVFFLIAGRGKCSTPWKPRPFQSVRKAMAAFLQFRDTVLPLAVGGSRLFNTLQLGKGNPLALLRGMVARLTTTTAPRREEKVGEKGRHHEGL